ncbi:carboxylating nicotinate-nucleotide diphosphorylase [Entomobacter blattae]|nr:carboxylating nicotinate-nucleotide diphosphorylase [Entomobacter blattae]
MVESLVRAGLQEDLGRAGDITTTTVIRPGLRTRTRFVARSAGCIAGLSLARMAFALIDRDVRFTEVVFDGNVVKAGETLAVVEGNARSILMAERVALNFLSHLSGIATATWGVVQSVKGTKAKICCTRKTLPGFRAIQKYAVRAGGGFSHRFGLDDAVLIKDNHIAVAGGIAQVLESIRSRIGHLVKVELEVDTLEQLEEGLACGGVDAFLLDNMPSSQLRQAVHIINGRAIAEASGGITPLSAPEIAQTGVDILSIGWLTHSVSALDIGLDYEGYEGLWEETVRQA